MRTGGGEDQARTEKQEGQAQEEVAGESKEWGDLSVGAGSGEDKRIDRFGRRRQRQRVERDGPTRLEGVNDSAYDIIICHMHTHTHIYIYIYIYTLAYVML